METKLLHQQEKFYTDQPIHQQESEKLQVLLSQLKNITFNYQETCRYHRATLEALEYQYQMRIKEVEDKIAQTGFTPPPSLQDYKHYHCKPNKRTANNHGKHGIVVGVGNGSWYCALCRKTRPGDLHKYEGRNWFFFDNEPVGKVTALFHYECKSRGLVEKMGDVFLCTGCEKSGKGKTYPHFEVSTRRHFTGRFRFDDEV